MRIFRNLAISLFGILLISSGGYVWNARFDYSPAERLLTLDKSSAIRFRQLMNGDQLKGCNLQSDGNNWMLFILETEVFPDNNFRGFFETAPDSRGIFVEYDPNDSENSMVLRIGVAGVSEIVLVPLRVVRRVERFFVAVGISQNELRVVSNSSDRRFPFVEGFTPQPQCEAIQLGIADGSSCLGCSVTVRFSQGSNLNDLDDALNLFSNSRQFNFRRLVGASLVLMGMCIILNRQRISNLDNLLS